MRKDIEIQAINDALAASVHDESTDNSVWILAGKVHAALGELGYVVVNKSDLKERNESIDSHAQIVGNLNDVIDSWKSRYHEFRVGLGKIPVSPELEMQYLGVYAQDRKIVDSMPVYHPIEKPEPSRIFEELNMEIRDLRTSLAEQVDANEKLRKQVSFMKMKLNSMYGKEPVAEKLGITLIDVNSAYPTELPPETKKWVNPLLEFLTTSTAADDSECGCIGDCTDETTGRGPFQMGELFGEEMIPNLTCTECGAAVPYEIDRQNHVAWHNKVADL